MTNSPAYRREASPYARNSSDTLADVLERVLDKGIVIAGDIAINVLDIELLTLKVRLLIASADTAKQMGINWWESDPFLTSRGRELESRGRELQEENTELRSRLERIEAGLAGKLPDLEEHRAPRMVAGGQGSDT